MPKKCRLVLPGVILVLCLLATRTAPDAISRGLAQEGSSRTKIAEGEYAVREQGSSGAVGPFQEEVYDFHESWTLWQAQDRQYYVEGVRRFESPRGEPHSNPFTVELTRDLTVVQAKEFAKLRWVRDSGPLSCEFLPAQMNCSSGGSDPKREIKLHTLLEKPYGLLWPISPFTFAGILKQVERTPMRATDVELVRIEQPGMANPVRATTLEGPLTYLGEEELAVAGKKWRAYKFSLKVASEPEYLIWTSHKGLLLATAVEHKDKNWPEEGLRLMWFEGPADF